jgi:Contractile injection system tube protein
MPANKWTPPGAKLQIASVDADLVVEAQYNPKEVQIAKQVPWNDKGSTMGGGNAGAMVLQYGGDHPRTLTLELVFDGYETGENVQYLVEDLELLGMPRDPQSTDPEWRRPHRIVVTWGPGNFRPFRCVIESVQTKYTMFGEDGTPLRALCTVALKEADLLEMAKQENVAARA